MDFEEVVGAASVPEKSIFILTILVAGAKPLVNNSVFCFFGLVPVTGAEGITLDPEVADFVCGGGSAGFVGDFCFEARKDFAAGAGLHFAGTIGNDHVQAFRGTESVEDFDAEALAEAFEKRRRKSFARGNRVTDAGEVELGTAGAMVIEQRCIVGGYGEKECGAIALDIGVDSGGRRTRGRKNRGGPDRKREVAGVAKPVREEEAGDAEAAIALIEFENGVGVMVRADHHVVMQVHATLGNASRA